MLSKQKTITEKTLSQIMAKVNETHTMKLSKYVRSMSSCTRLSSVSLGGKQGA